MKFRKLVAMALISGMIVGCSGWFNEYHVFAESSVASDSTSESQSNESQSSELEDVLTKVKKRITIPEEFSEFYYFCRNYSDTTYWNLNWNNTETSESIMIQCDAKGNIYYYTKVGAEDKEGNASYLASELKAKADAYVRKICKAAVYKNLSYTHSEYNSYNNTYAFYYQRIMNDIPVADQYLEIMLNANTGEVRDFYADWDYELTFPYSNTLMTKEEAISKLSEVLDMKLEYHAYQEDENSTMQGNLIYVPSESYLSIDALNGTIYNSMYSITYNGEYTEGSTSDSLAYGSSGNAYLTENELSKIDELSNLISKEEAITSLKSYTKLFIDSSATTVNASLYQTSLDPSDPEKKSYIWNICLSDDTPVNYETGDYYRAYITAGVDAKTGEVLSFYAEPKSPLNGSSESYALKYSVDDGQKIAEKFLKNKLSKYYDEVAYTESSYGYAMQYTQSGAEYGGQTYTFSRLVNDVEAPFNQITISVDLVTGKIYSLYYDWYESVEFESTEGIISAETAEKNYFDSEEFKLTYEIIIDDETEEKTARLVYRTENCPEYIDAFTGKQVYYDGTEYVDGKPYSYSDIADCTNQRIILLLADMGIGFEGSQFLPNQAITKTEMQQLIDETNIYRILSTSFECEGDVTRLAAAKFAIKVLNLDLVAQLDIYKPEFNDSESMNQDELGYAVLADELGLVVAKEGNFNPQETITREDAAVMIYRLVMKYHTMY